jgi:hypothetical protein
MADENTGAAGAAGAGTAGAGNAGAAGAAGATGNAGAATPWHSTYEPEIQTFVQSKGWDKFPIDKALPEIIRGYRGAEQYIGVPADQVVRLPKDGDDAALGRVYDRLGRPTDATKYDLKLPAELDEKTSSWIKTTAHKLGMNNKQAQTFANDLLATETASAIEAKAALDSRVAKESAELRTEWGGAYEKNVEVVDGVAREFGMTPEQLVALRGSLGPKGAMAFLYKIGQSLGEDKFISGDNRQGFGDAKAPNVAMQEIASLKADSEFVAKFQKGDAEAVKKWARLHEQAYPQQSAA